MRRLLIFVLVVALLTLVVCILSGCAASIGVPKASQEGGSEQMLYVKQVEKKAGECTSECWLSREAVIQFKKLGLKTGVICGGVELDVSGLEQGDASITRDVVAANAELAKMRQEFIQEFGPKVGLRFFDYLVGRLGLPVPE